MLDKRLHSFTNQHFVLPSPPHFIVVVVPNTSVLSLT